MSISSIFSSRKGLEKVMGDVVRVLWLYKRLWLSEIYSEISGMNSSINDGVPSYNEVVKAVEELSKRGIVKLDKRVRGSLGSSKGIEDVLVSLIITDDLIKEIANDEKLYKYRKLREELFKHYRS